MTIHPRGQTSLVGDFSVDRDEDTDKWITDSTQLQFALYNGFNRSPCDESTRKSRDTIRSSLAVANVDSQLIRTVAKGDHEFQTWFRFNLALT